jgi:hypothetical protein
MADPVRNQREPRALTDADVDAAIGRIEARDPARGRDARHVYDDLTWATGPGALSQSGVQDWAWYRLATKYLTDEPGYMGRLAAIAAELFDELGLDAYAAVCRSESTAEVHEAYGRSDRDGFDAMRKAVAASGIQPPDLDDFEWGRIRGIEEANARSAVEDALERAISVGGLVVGGRNWRTRQRDITAQALHSDHPSQPGQSWRTAIVTERLGTWADAEARRSATLTRLRAGVARRLLHPVAAPPDVAERMQRMTWLLDRIGDEQRLTPSGYLGMAFLRMLHEDPAWHDPFVPDTPPRTEADAFTLRLLRSQLMTMGALRRQGSVLKRTARGAAMATDPVAAWAALTRKVPSDPWKRFVLETCALVLVDRDEPVPPREVTAIVTQIASELGWRTKGGRRAGQELSEPDVSWSIRNAVTVYELLGMLTDDGDWLTRQWTLTPSGTSTLLATLRTIATGPISRP